MSSEQDLPCREVRLLKQHLFYTFGVFEAAAEADQEKVKNARECARECLRLLIDALPSGVNVLDKSMRSTA